MSAENNSVRPVARILGGVIGGAGTYLAAQWFNAWNLSDGVIVGLAGLMAVAGFWFGPKIWDVVIQFV